MTANARTPPSLRAQRSNPDSNDKLIASQARARRMLASETIALYAAWLALAHSHPLSWPAGDEALLRADDEWWRDVNSIR